MKYTFPTLLLLCLGFSITQAQPMYRTAEMDVVDLVNPLMGTDSKFSLSNGNTYPAIALPWGMNFWSPQTAKMGDGWMYAYDAEHIRGFKQTHQPSPWINDYAAFSLMPVTGSLKFRETERASWFSHKAEIARPHYYKVYLADHDVTTEITPTERAAQFRFTFPQTDSAYIVLDAFNEGSMVKVLPKERKIIGYCRNNSGGVPSNFHNYFVLEFNKDFKLARTWNDTTLLDNELEVSADHVGAVIGFATRAGEQIEVKVASSFISPEQAALNLRQEIGDDNFDRTLEKAHSAWTKELQRIQIEDDNLDNLRTFYSCLYRLLLFPRKFYETDATGQIVHYSPYSGGVLPGYMFTDNGFWDTFRAVFPFFTLMYPELNSQIMQGLVNTYEESGWLPEWASPGHRDCMIGSNSASLIADSYIKGIRGYDIDKLYEAALKNTRGKGPVNSVGRYGAEYYNRLGYVPYDVGINENAARTLEYAYADFALWQLAKALGKTQMEVEVYAKRAQNYRKLFDPTTNLMRGKNENGEFQSPFSPFKWGDAFTEGNSWHYSWSVFQDVQGYIDLVGGRENFTAKLDSVFTLRPVFDESYYGFVIHEIREMQIAGMGQYAHGNQPIQHLIYLYNYSGAPWKSQQRVREVLTKLYSSAPDGYCGDEDNGQTSAWYVFSAMGFYPVCPGTPEYVFGSPLFQKMRLHMENGNTFDLIARDNGAKQPFIQSARLNGQPFDKTWISHDALWKGGMLEFQMSETPNQAWATDPAASPYSMSTEGGR